MTETVYDRHADFYLDFIDRGLASENGYTRLLLETLVACLAERLPGARVCDLCCGEGYVGRRLLTRGAREVVGIDASAALIEAARARADAPGLSYRVDDARTLGSAIVGEFDLVVSQMAMMDVADHRALFAAVRRILLPGAPFVFSMLHPCFEGRPFHVRDAPPYVVDEAGRPVAFAVRRYASEGFWDSGGDGVRGHMGSYHRMLSTYVNDLIAAGFALERLEEPLAGADAARAGLFAEVPTVLVVAAHAI
ncbi:MAG TPA: methyltransferase domain-containing protein [Caulobacteraceae bacterium]|jgi:SAM-dependent methyltransferase|nr:methyltransferase domain-containing protein [Caulobacteraceae bacterium]